MTRPNSIRPPAVNAKYRRLIRTVPTTKPPDDAPEGRRAAWWRENVVKISRPVLAEHLGITIDTILRNENLEKIPRIYRLACASVDCGDDNWNWGGFDRLIQTGLEKPKPAPAPARTQADES